MQTRRWIDRAQEELEELVTLLQRLEQGPLGAEVRPVRRHAQRALRFVEQANVAELVAAAMLREGQVGARLRQRALDCGLMPVVLIEREREEAA